MRIRNFANQPRPHLANALDLAPRRSVTVSPDSECRPVPVELDIAVLLESGQVGLLTCLPALLELGLTPAASAVTITSSDPLQVLRLWVRPGPTPVELVAGRAIARLLLLELPNISLVDDAILDDTLEPQYLTPYAQPIRPRQAPFGSESDD